jgi:methylamine dehydrogenase heavy chain
MPIKHTKSITGVMMIGASFALATLATELAPESPSVAKLMPDNGHRLYLVDIAFHGRVLVVDGDTLRMLGEFGYGLFGNFVASHDRKTLYSDGTFLSRGDHGQRSDVVEIREASTLNLTGEIVLPTKRAETVPEQAYLQESAGGTYLFVQNATPAQSVTVVDVLRKKVLAEIPTAGCFGIYPSPKRAGRFSTLCGDGSAETITFDARGQETGRRRSGALFDVDNDALFITGVRMDDAMIFVSFRGNVHEINFAGEKAVQKMPWSIVSPKEAKEGWRPGGFQLIAYHRATGQLYVCMHPGGFDGSHKNPAKEIWKVDVAKQAVSARMSSDGALNIAVSNDIHPILFSENMAEGTESPTFTKYDATKMLKLPLPTPSWTLHWGGPLTVL